MKKHLTLSFLSLALASTAFAQEKGKQTHFGNIHLNPVVKNGLAKQAELQGTVSKTTNSGQRLLSTAQLYQGAVEDSFIYVWGGNRSTVHTSSPEDLFYAGSEYYPEGPVKNLPYAFEGRYFTQKPDTAINYYDDGSGITLYSIAANSYNSNNDLAKHDFLYSASSGNQLTYYNLSYNTNGDLTMIEKYVDTTSAQGGTYVLARTIFSSYNSGTLMKDSIVDHIYGSNTSIYDYYQNTAGKDSAITMTDYNAFTGTYDLYAHYLIDYYPSNMIKSVKGYSTAGLEEVDSFGYAGSNAFPVYHIQYYMDLSNPGSISYGSERINTLNSNGDVQTSLINEYDYSTGSWENMMRYTVTYNSFFNPDYLTYDEYNGSGWDNNVGRVNFHYQTLTSVAEAKKYTSITLYPNPATDMVTISTSNNETATISVTDMQGRLLQQYNTRSNSTTLDLKNLPTGTYLATYETATTIGTVKMQKQ